LSIVGVVPEESIGAARAQYDPPVGDDVRGGGYEHSLFVQDGMAVSALREERSHAVPVGEDAGAEGEVGSFIDVADLNVSGATDEFVDEIYGREPCRDAEAIGRG